MSSCRHEIHMRYRARMKTDGHEARNVGDIRHRISAYIAGNLADSLEVYDA